MTHQPNHHMPPCGCPPMQPVAVGEINYSAEQINQLLALIPLKMDRKELHGLISYTSDNYIGHVPDTTSLKPQKAFAWAFVGELSGASPYFHYTPDFIPEGLEEGWNDMSSFFGKYNMTPSKKEDTISAEELFAGYFRLPTLTADKAIADEQGNRIIDTYVKREAVANHIKETYNKQFTENPPLITKGYITPEMLSEETRQMLEATGQDITNLPDGEDLQAVHGVLKFANKEYNPNSYDGLGRQYIRRNVVNGVNTLVQSMVQWSNTLYIIRYDHDLQGRTITIPEGCTLMFESGKFFNGKLVLNDTQVRPYGCLLKDYIDCQIEGTFRKGQVLYSEQYKQTEVWTGKKWKCSYSVLFRVYGNKLQQSVDDGETWEDVSDYIASYFRFVASSGQNSVGKIQISQDNKTWTDLSPEITNYMRIADYVATTAELPKNAPKGLIYGVGPVDGAYTLYVNTSDGWINNGSFTSFTAGVVQETGDNENVVMSQKAVTEKFNEQEGKLAELGSEVLPLNIVAATQNKLADGYNPIGLSWNYGAWEDDLTELPDTNSVHAGPFNPEYDGYIALSHEDLMYRVIVYNLDGTLNHIKPYGNSQLQVFNFYRYYITVKWKDNTREKSLKWGNGVVFKPFSKLYSNDVLQNNLKYDCIPMQFEYGGIDDYGNLTTKTNVVRFKDYLKIVDDQIVLYNTPFSVSFVAYVSQFDSDYNFISISNGYLQSESPYYINTEPHAVYVKISVVRYDSSMVLNEVMEHIFVSSKKRERASINIKNSVSLEAGGVADNDTYVQIGMLSYDIEDYNTNKRTLCLDVNGASYIQLNPNLFKSGKYTVLYEQGSINEETGEDINAYTVFRSEYMNGDLNLKIVLSGNVKVYFLYYDANGNFLYSDPKGKFNQTIFLKKIGGKIRMIVTPISGSISLEDCQNISIRYYVGDYFGATLVSYDSQQKYITQQKFNEDYYSPIDSLTKYIRICVEPTDTRIENIDVVSDIVLKEVKNSIYRTNESDDYFYERLTFKTSKDSCATSWLVLPKNYSFNGEKVPMIIYFDGSGNQTSWNSTLSSYDFKIRGFKYLRDEGYAVLMIYSWGSYYANKYPSCGMAKDYPSPTIINNIKKGVEYILDRYNIDGDNIHVMSKSQGGQMAYYLLGNNYINVKSVGMFSPVLDYLSMFCSDLYIDTRKAIAEDNGFIGNVDAYIGKGYRPYSDVGREFTMVNLTRLIGLNDAWHGLVGGTSESRLQDSLDDCQKFWKNDQTGANELQGDTERTDIYNHRDYAKIGCGVPCKIWGGTKDVDTPYLKMVEAVSQLQNGGCEASLRVFEGGGHGSPDGSLFQNGVTSLGIPYTDVPIGFIENVQFIREHSTK